MKKEEQKFLLYGITVSQSYVILYKFYETSGFFV